MPELPEVQAICTALKQEVLGRRFKGVEVRESRLRWPVNERELRRLVQGQRVVDVERIAKYIVIRFENGASLLIHLGMSGHLGLTSRTTTLRKHDHIIFSVGSGQELRYHDPRRFGMLEAVEKSDFSGHPRLQNLGIEPFSSEFTGEELYRRSRGVTIAVKKFVMDSKRIVGVGNIYASEALFLARIHPTTKAGRISLRRWERLRLYILEVLSDAIERGGTTIRDFANLDGRSGYFTQELKVYARDGQKCFRCGGRIRKVNQSSRSTFYCPGCQH